MTLFPVIIDCSANAQEHPAVTCLVGGGVIPDEDVEALEVDGRRRILGQDTPPDAIVDLRPEPGRRAGVTL